MKDWAAMTYDEHRRLLGLPEVRAWIMRDRIQRIARTLGRRDRLRTRSDGRSRRREEHMNDPYSALDVLDDLHAVGVWPVPLWTMGVAVCHDCGHQLGTFERERTLCALCERAATSAMLRRYLTDDERTATVHHWQPGDPEATGGHCGAPSATLDRPRGEGLSRHGASGTPDPFGSVPVLSPRNRGTHRARGTAPAAIEASQ